MSLLEGQVDTAGAYPETGAIDLKIIVIKNIRD